MGAWSLNFIIISMLTSYSDCRWIAVWNSTSPRQIYYNHGFQEIIEGLELVAQI
jgi:hypothetical protein